MPAVSFSVASSANSNRPLILSSGTPRSPSSGAGVVAGTDRKRLPLMVLSGVDERTVQLSL